MVVVVAADRLVHQFVDDNVANPNRTVVRARCVGGEGIKIVCAVRPATVGNAICLRTELHGVQDAAAVGLDEAKRFARAIERETELRLREGNKTRRADHGAPWNDKFIGRWIIGQNTTRNIHAVRAVIVEFDELRHGWILRMRQDFVDDHASQRAGMKRIHLPRRTAHGIADVPGARVAFAITWIGQNDGMARAVGGHRPRIGI